MLFNKKDGGALFSCMSQRLRQSLNNERGESEGELIYQK